MKKHTYLKWYDVSGYEGYFVKAVRATFICDNAGYQAELRARSDKNAVKRVRELVRNFKESFKIAKWYKFKVTLRRRGSKAKRPLLTVCTVKNVK